MHPWRRTFLGKKKMRKANYKGIWVACFLPASVALLVYCLSARYGQHWAWSNSADKWDDNMMVFKSRRAKPVGNEWSYEFIDFDDRTAALQHDPVLIPATLLANVLDQIRSGRPAAIFIDLDLSYLQDASDLQALQKALLDLDSTGTPVFLERQELPAFDRVAAHFRESTALDALIGHSGNLAWFSAVVIPSADGLDRRFPLYIRDSIGVGHKITEVVPSAALSLLLLKHAGSEPKAKELFSNAIDNPSQACPTEKQEGTICFGTQVPIMFRHEVNRINYTMQWKATNALFYSTSASDVLDSAKKSMPVADGGLSNTVVIVGSSSVDRGDLHSTALGEMPGSLIIVNSMRSWMPDGPDEWPKPWLSALLLFLCTMLFSIICFAAFARLAEEWHGKATSVLGVLFSLASWAGYYVFGFAGAGMVIVILQLASKHLVENSPHGPNGLFMKIEDAILIFLRKMRNFFPAKSTGRSHV